MARMISAMFPPAHTDPATQSEPEDGVTSDIRGKSSHPDIGILYFIANINGAAMPWSRQCQYNSYTAPCL